ncbi:MAG: tRNA (adenosine(37)-N6)-dimethylallyltransferase MiaA [Flavobacteriaceae bacterium]|nr:tRNA (adenosine(37)-N6)-dimethylallyltransferase MiaA [Flavobacteriaceae bacterium]RCL65723.1 MAG: tRNA (adenosine(37)-N6)-dimethylallyltransferase MiaA [Cryomorphaceae bacterium]
MNKTLITISGPTAVGKTKFSIDLAKLLNCQIISCDSRQFYKELSIGTAIPSKKELNAVKHHYIHHKSINDTYTVKDFQKDALNKIKELFISDEFIILVGGSGLYMDAVIYGLDDFPEIDKKVRENLNLKLNKFGIIYLQKKLQKLDPEYYSKVDLKNPRRLIRALEVCISSNKPFSSYVNKKKTKHPFKLFNIGIVMDRDKLYEKINSRVDQMFSQGLVNEVKGLIDFKNYNALKTLGYKELFQFIENKCTLNESIEEIKKNTRRYAKRQITWLKSKNDITYINSSTDAKLVQKTYFDFK